METTIQRIEAQGFQEPSYNVMSKGVQIIKVIHLWNHLCGTFCEKRFKEGRKWFYDIPTALNHWYPKLGCDTRDTYTVVVANIITDKVFWTDVQLDNKSVRSFIDEAKASSKTIIRGVWDSCNTQQFYLLEMTTDYEIFGFSSSDLKIFMETLCMMF